MRAFAFDEFDTPGLVREVPVPEPEAGQVRVRVAAAATNPADIAVIKGLYKDMMPHHFPLIPGLDFAGTIDAVGPQVSGWSIGDPVFGGQGKMSRGHGTLAEYATASESSIARRTDTLDPEFAAALPLAGLSALEVIDAMAVGKGDVVVVLGAAGGIGGFAVQLAKAAGARVVAVTRATNHAYVRDLGADEVVDYSTQDVHDVVSAAHPDGIAGIVHTAGDKAYVARLSELVREGGHVVSMVMGADIEALASRGVTGVNVMTATTGPALERLGELVTTGALRRPHIKAFPLHEANEAFGEIQTGHTRGKVLVTP
jgi:NADPH:quinone reductase